MRRGVQIAAVKEHYVELEDLARALAQSEELTHLNANDIYLVLDVFFYTIDQIDGKLTFGTTSFTKVTEPPESPDKIH